MPTGCWPWGTGSARCCIYIFCAAGGRCLWGRRPGPWAGRKRTWGRRRPGLGRAGLLQEDERRLAPADELPEYRAEDIVRRSREDPAFRDLVSEAQRVLGHSLSGADLKTLFGVYDRLGMPAEVIMLVIHRCAETARRRYGEGRLPTMRAIEKEAYLWANREILTARQAEEYLEGLDRRDEAEDRLRALLQLRDRTPTPTERKYMDAWLAMGFDIPALGLAYDRTVVSTGKLSWAYMGPDPPVLAGEGAPYAGGDREGGQPAPARPAAGTVRRRGSRRREETTWSGWNGCWAIRVRERMKDGWLGPGESPAGGDTHRKPGGGSPAAEEVYAGRRRSSGWMGPSGA